MSLPNFTYLGKNFYVVRTQAGFKQALKHFVSAEEYPSYKNDIVGYPGSYPSLVHLSLGYRGSNYIRADYMHITKLVAELNQVDPK